MVFCGQDLNVMIGTCHYCQHQIIAIEPSIVSFDLNDTHIFVERHSVDKSARESCATSFVSVLTARWRVFVLISGADYVVNVHLHLLFEIRVLGMKEVLKYAISNLRVDLINGLFW